MPTRERVARILIAGTIISTEMTYIIDESELDLLNLPTWIATLATNASIYSRMILEYLNVSFRMCFVLMRKGIKQR